MRSSRHRRIALVTAAVFGGLAVGGDGLHLLPAWRHAPVPGTQVLCAHGDAFCGHGQSSSPEECEPDGAWWGDQGGDGCRTCTYCPICQFSAQGKLLVPPVAVSSAGPADFHAPLGLPPDGPVTIHSPFAARAPPIG